jgi:hypothetical protein
MGKGRTRDSEAGDRETKRQGDKKTGRQKDRETRRQGDKETGDTEMTMWVSQSPLCSNAKKDFSVAVLFRNDSHRCGALLFRTKGRNLSW